MNILILGNGFCGSNLALGLQESEYNLVIVDKIKPLIQPPYKFYQRDILQHDYADVLKNHKPDVVFYLISESQSEDAYSVDVSCFLKFLKLCVEYKIKKVIILSSYDLTHENCATCNSTHKYKLQPMEPNLINQFVFEMYLHHFKEQYGVNFASLRTSHIYGYKEHEYWCNNIINDLISENDVVLNVNGSSFTNLIYIGDVVSSLIYSLRDDVSGIYNIIHNDIQYKTIVEKIKTLKVVNVNFNNKAPIITKKSCTILNTLNTWKPIVGLDTGIAVIKQSITNKSIKNIKGTEMDKTKEVNTIKERKKKVQMVLTCEKNKDNDMTFFVVKPIEEKKRRVRKVKIEKPIELVIETPVVETVVETQKRMGRPKKVQVEPIVEVVETPVIETVVETPKRMGRPKKVQVEPIVEVVETPVIEAVVETSKKKMGRPKKVQIESTVEIETPVVEAVVETPKKKMGRPKKVQIESTVEIETPVVEAVVETPKKKMGRPKKVQIESKTIETPVVETVVETPKKKMGRPKKVQIESTVEIETPVVEAVVETPKKKMGRPKKVQIESKTIETPVVETVVETPKKKMGRPKKVQIESTVEIETPVVEAVVETPKKKMGRPKKVQIESKIIETPVEAVVETCPHPKVGCAH